jgi:hypothetical protein
MNTKSFYFTVDVEVSSIKNFFNYKKVLSDLLIFEKKINYIQKILNINFPITWFLRCDDTVKYELGSEDGFLFLIKNFIERRKKKGDYFGFHPHLYQLKKKKWILIKDNFILKKKLYRFIKKWESFFFNQKKISRIGDLYMNNFILKILDDNQFFLDTTALPGRKRFDDFFSFDWSKTKNKPYHPSINNYQVTGIKTRRILELPISTINFKSNYDKFRLNRYLNPAFKNTYLINSINQLKFTKNIISLTHPFEFLDLHKNKNNLFSESQDEIINNFKLILKFFKRINFKSLNNYKK